MWGARHADAHLSVGAEELSRRGGASREQVPAGASLTSYPNSWLTWLLASVSDSGGFLPVMTLSMAGVMMPVIWEAWSVIGYKKVVFSSHGR